MRIAILSDIHGNALALDAVLADIAASGPFDQIIVAGDLVWSGPWPAAVVDRVRSLNAAVIQGNTDAFFHLPPEEAPDGKSPERFALQLEWMRAQLGPERVSYLAGLPFSHRVPVAGGHDLFVVHANPLDMEQAITPGMTDGELDGLLMDSVARQPWGALAFGHLHVAFQRRWRGRLLVDVASAGLPMDGDPRATWAILTWMNGGWHAEHRRVFYNAQVVAHQMRTGGMPRGKHFAERLMMASYRDAVQPATMMTIAD